MSERSSQGGRAAHDGFNPRELSNILRVVAENRDLLLRAWHDHFGD
jgi:hypothetical protein